MNEEKLGVQITAALKELIEKERPGIAFVAILHEEDEECAPTMCHAMTNGIGKEEVVSVLLGIMENMDISIMDMQLGIVPAKSKPKKKGGLDLDDGYISSSK